jgi:hypothetical protein
MDIPGSSANWNVALRSNETAEWAAMRVHIFAQTINRQFLIEAIQVRFLFRSYMKFGGKLTWASFLREF